MLESHNVKITKPFETAAGFEYLRVEITISFVKECLWPPSLEYMLLWLMRGLKK